MVKKAKKRVVKPYRRNKIIKGLQEAVQFTNLSSEQWSALNTPKSVGKPINLTLCEQLEETITRLENRVSNSIARINALIGQI